MAASLLGVFAAAESSGAVTTGSRTTVSGSLITVACGGWAIPDISVPTDNKSNTYTERVEVGCDSGDSSNGRINLSYNIGGTRGASHTCSKIDDGAANSIGAQEWDGVEASPTIASATAQGTGTAPAASVAVGASSLSLLIFGYADASTTFTVNDGTLAQEIDENSDNQAIGVHYKVGQTGTPSITATLTASRDWGAAIVCFTESSGGGQNITDTGNIASAEAHGTTLLNIAVQGAGNIPSAEAHGTQKVNLALLNPGNIPSLEGFGTAVLAPGGVSITGAGNIPSAEAHGAQKVNLALLNLGNIPSLEGFGTAVLAPGGVSITGAGNIPSEQAFGTALLNQALISNAGNIPSAEAHGTALLNVAVQGAGNIPSSENFISSDASGALFWDLVPGVDGYRVKIGGSTGNYNIGSVDVGNVTIVNLSTLATALGLAPGAKYFAIVVGLLGGVEQTPSDESNFVLGAARVFVHVTAVGAASAEAFGTAKINQVLGCQGIPSAQAFGTTLVSSGGTLISNAGNIPSLEAFGTALLRLIMLGGGNIPSAEAHGSAALGMLLFAVGAQSAEAFGTALLATGAITITGAGGMTSAEEFGDAVVQSGASFIQGAGNIPSEAGFGIGQMNWGLIDVGDIDSAEGFGAAALAGLVITVSVGIPSQEQFGFHAMIGGTTVRISAMTFTFGKRRMVFRLD